MARRGREADAEAAEVEVDVARGAQLHFDRRVAAGRDFAQLERPAEALADFGPHGRGIELHARLPGPHDQPLARGRADAVVVREADVVRCAACALAAEDAASQVQRERRGNDGARRADRHGTLQVGAVGGVGQHGASAEFGGQLHGVEVGDVLFAVAAQNAYFRKNHRWKY